jgi:tetratricopeptide (TPR) repeat protein
MVYPPEKEGSIKDILGEDWDPDTNRKRALETSQLQSQMDPQNAFTWFNLGTNLIYFDRYSEAAAAYDQARTLGLPQRMLRYQFGPFIAYFNAFRTEDLKGIAKYALNITPNSEEAHLWYGWALYREGDKAGAASEFRKALFNDETYGDAEYALNYLVSN